MNDMCLELTRLRDALSHAKVSHANIQTHLNSRPGCSSSASSVDEHNISERRRATVARMCEEMSGNCIAQMEMKKEIAFIGREVRARNERYRSLSI